MKKNPIWVVSKTVFYSIVVGLFLWIPTRHNMLMAAGPDDVVEAQADDEVDEEPDLDLDSDVDQMDLRLEEPTGEVEDVASDVTASADYGEDGVGFIDPGPGPNGDGTDPCVLRSPAAEGGPAGDEQNELPECVDLD